MPFPASQVPAPRRLTAPLRAERTPAAIAARPKGRTAPTGRPGRHRAGFDSGKVQRRRRPPHGPGRYRLVCELETHTAEIRRPTARPTSPTRAHSALPALAFALDGRPIGAAGSTATTTRPHRAPLDAPRPSQGASGQGSTRGRRESSSPSIGRRWNGAPKRPVPLASPCLAPPSHAAPCRARPRQAMKAYHEKGSGPKRVCAAGSCSTRRRPTARPGRHRAGFDSTP